MNSVLGRLFVSDYIYIHITPNMASISLVSVQLPDGAFERTLNCLVIFINLVSFLDEYFPTDIVQKIRQGYMNNADQLRSPPWCKEFNFHLETLSTKLRITDKTVEEYTSQAIHLKDLFIARRSGQKPRTVLIEGKPGIGKTTYCQKLAYDWARKLEEIEKSLPQIQVLLSLQCRDITSDIWKAIDAQLLSEFEDVVDEQSKEMFFTFIRENQSKVLLILDGLDDMPPEKLQMISQLVKGELPQCNFLLTAKRATAVKMREYCDTWLEIVGFIIDVKTFVSKYFEDQEDLAKKLFEVLGKFDNLRKEVDLGNPIYTALLCLLCKELNGVFPSSITQLYTEIILCALRRFENLKDASSSSEDLIELHKDQLTCLGLIAFNYQRKGDSLDREEDKEAFNMGELPEFWFTSAQTAGSTRRPPLWCGFEQFFAGFFLASQIVSGEIDLNSIITDQSYFNKPAMRQVFLYMSGILGLQSEKKALDFVKSICSRINSLRLGNAADIRELQQLLMLALECREYDSDCKDNLNSKLTETVGSFLKLETFTLGSLFGHNYKDLLKSNAFNNSWYRNNCYRGYCPQLAGLARPFFEALKSNTTLSTLLLCNNEIEPSGANALSGALKVNGALTNLDLGRNKIGTPGAQALFDALQINATLTKLDLSGNEIGTAGIQSLSEVLKSNSSLTSLNLCDNKIGEKREGWGSRCPREISIVPYIRIKITRSLPEALVKLDEYSKMDETRNYHGLFSLSESLKINTTLTNLNLAYNEIDFVGAHYLSEALKANTGLTALNLQGNRIDSLGAKCLSLSLATNSTLTSLNVSAIGFGDKGAQALSEALPDNATLTKLDLSSNGIGVAGAQCISTALANNSALTSLVASHNAIDATGSQHISEALAHNHTLTSLDISYSKIGGAGALFLSEALQTNDTLTDLNLEFAEVDERGAVCLFDALKDNTTLSSLDFTTNCISWHKDMTSFAKYLPLCQLSDILKVNVTLTSLKLCKNDLSPSGVQGLFEALSENRTLKDLDLERMRMRFNLPLKFLTSNKALTHLNLSRNLFNDPSILRSIFEALRVNSTLTCLKLESVKMVTPQCTECTIGDSECQFISETLKVNTTLTDLDLSGNSTGDVGIQCISAALKVNTTLKYLNLTGQRCKYDTDLQCLWDALKINNTVFVLL